MLKHLSLLLIFFLHLSAMGQSITVQEAKTTALQFLSQFEEQNYSPQDVEEIRFYTYGGQNSFYVVQLKNKAGYVLVSPTKAAYPILGYVPQAEFKVEEMPQATKNLYSDYARQVLDIQQKKLTSTPSIRARWKSLLPSSAKGPTTAVPPLLSTIWSQGCYFNDSTPADPGGPCGHAVTGCVATAMGQVINYHKFPPNGSGSHSYMSSYGTLTANFGNTNYAWNLMVDTLDGNTSAASVAAVSQLLGHCGVAVDMMYSGGSSGAYSEDALNAVVHYFNYSPETQMLYRDNFTDSIWALMVMEELDSLRPLYYDGSGTGGHAFVCDGYQNNMFHFNWGWNGSHNGYFLISNLNPGGMNFGQYNAAFFGMKPLLPSTCSAITDTLMQASGHLSDGSSYQDYAPNASCSWVIQPAGAQVLSLTFHSFDLALDDTLFIFDGNSMNAPLIQYFTGDSLPAPLATSSGAAFVWFKSNASQQAAGWSISYKSEFCQGNTVLTAPTGQISDGSGSFLYNNNTSCTWLISPQSPGPIVLEFLSFKTEASYDYVYVYDGTDANAPNLATLDGHNLPASLTATSGNMFIRFTSDGGVVDEGWSARYSVCDSLNPTPMVSQIEFCEGDSIFISPSNMGDSISWLYNKFPIGTDSSLWAKEDGTYSFILYRGLCGTDTSTSISLFKHANPTPYLGTDTFVCTSWFTGGFELTLPFDTTNFAYNHYSWNTGDTGSFILMSNFSGVQNDTNMLFTIHVSDSNNCFGNDSIIVHFHLCKSINEPGIKSLEVAPNPVSTSLTLLDLPADNYELIIFDAKGKRVLNTPINTTKIDVHELASGLYFGQIQSVERVYVFKFMKE